MSMEKYGVCKTCYGKPISKKDLEKTFVKTASGNYKCPICGQHLLKELNFNETIQVDDKEE